MRTHDWFRSHSFHYREFGSTRELANIKRERGASVTLILPTRNVADTIGSVLTEVGRLRRGGLIDQVLVIDHFQSGESASHCQIVATERGRMNNAAIHSRKCLLINIAPGNNRAARDVTTAQRFG